jgi:hypothetical protein
MRYYAYQSPHGFANEVNVLEFPSASSRDRWVEMHKEDGGVNSASLGACSAKEAKRLLKEEGSRHIHVSVEGDVVILFNNGFRLKSEVLYSSVEYLSIQIPLPIS